MGTCWRYAYELRPLPPDLLAPQIPWPHAHALQEQLEVCALQEVTPWPNIIVWAVQNPAAACLCPHVSVFLVACKRNILHLQLAILMD